ncbi:EF-hand domain pair containing protein [Tanacetum coccineum]
MISFRVIAFALSMLTIIGMVKGRWLDRETYSTSMISYGVHNISNENPPDLELRISNSSTSYGGKRCESLYRFLPCADTMPEGVLLMFLYTYLMISGEEWMNTGSKLLYVWIGTDEKVGASVFRVLMALPKIVVIVVPGILSSSSDAQNQVVFGVNMYAGSTVITLTLVWGISIIFSNHKRSSPDSSIKCLSHSSIKCLSLLTDTSIKIDKKTGIIAVIMLLSLIPFAFVGLVSFVNTPAMTLTALIVSGVSLLLYFGFQVCFDLSMDWGQEFDKLEARENLTISFLEYIKKLAEHFDLVDKEGKPDFTCFKSFFYKFDEDKDGSISHGELEALVEEVFQLENDNISKEYAITEIFIHFDKNNNGKISWEEFEEECTNWLEKWNNEANSSGSAYKIIWDEANIDKDNDDVINKDELKQFIETLDSGIELDHDRVLHALVEDFDDDKNNVVEKREFVEGFIKWIEQAINHDLSVEDTTEAIAKIPKGILGEKDTLETWEKLKAIVYVIFGAAIMITITSAFITSVKQFSNAAQIPFLFTSFVMAPIAIKAKMAIKELLKPHDRTNDSLTYSEIYDGLVMDNLLGLSTLLTILYIKGLSWTYSAEVFTIMIPCAIVGIFAFIRDNYPLWASIPAILLYPVSVYIYFLLANA